MLDSSNVEPPLNFKTCLKDHPSNIFCGPPRKVGSLQLRPLLSPCCSPSYLAVMNPNPSSHMFDVQVTVIWGDYAQTLLNPRTWVFVLELMERTFQTIALFSFNGISIFVHWCVYIYMNSQSFDIYTRRNDYVDVSDKSRFYKFSSLETKLEIIRHAGRDAFQHQSHIWT